MQPRTLTVPKALLEVAGKPFVDWQLALLARCRFSEVVMCIAHLGDQIRAHVGDGRRFGLDVRYSEEGPKLLGTAGALRAALPALAPAFVVTYGDSYLPFDYGALLDELDAHPDCDGVMSVYKNEGRWDASNVRVARDESGAWVQAYAKGTRDPAYDHIDYGAIALRRAIVEGLPQGQVSGLDGVQASLAAARRLRAHVASHRFYEIGSPEGLAALEAFLRSSSSDGAP